MAEMSHEEWVERTQGKNDPRCPAVDDPKESVHLAHAKDCDK